MIDLSPCLGLVILRISIDRDDAWPMVFDTLSMIAPSNHIRQIMICGKDEIAAEELDSRLSSLPMHHSPVFQFEMDPDDYANIAPSLPRLTSKNMFRRADRHDVHDNWFQSYTLG
ncbi:hypothetical protein DFH09DRAFT_1317847 [Mycena vulgaris]|nr:hypothetical protein DFH09DRAFT_1317847 [Mycena vulgaris]